MKTVISDMLGVEFPILAFSHQRDVVAAVTNAGGMGVLGAVSLTPEELETELTWIDEHTKGKPYGVDVIVPAKYVGDSAGGLSKTDLDAFIPEEHREFIDHLMEKYNVPPLPKDYPKRTGLLSWSHKGTTELLDIAFSHPISLIANALGPPPEDMIKQAHEKNIPVAALAGKIEHALKNVSRGVDIIVAQGYEAGGHTGDIATMVLVPEVVDAIAPIPVLAAGGIGRGRQMAAAMALGAQGVWTGSVWLTTEEAETEPVVKQKMLRATSSDTVKSRAMTGKPARQLRSAWTDEWEEPQAPSPLPMPLQSMLIVEALQRIHRSVKDETSGPGQLANYFVGQIVGSLNKVTPARQVVLDMVEEFVEVITGFDKLLQDN
ncbi:MAG: nitronate monooxygenase [Actinobacteria bacterium]|jgi:NAD(P)H-dependent flavin oxidoreductase YrpB (nitropropane dioxygenase family)|nr:nitronate monooxygenase [Actinomycetota bacterium]MCL6105105.1 nitronate monooxygenase [Actinomycetota bacterium]